MQLDYKTASNNMIKKILTIGFIALNGLAFGQETWSLEKCVSYAQENSRLVKQSQVGVSNAKLSQKLADYDRYPSVSAGSNFGLNFGRSVNPSTYAFENRSTNFQSWSLNANVILYNGGRLNNAVRQSELDIKASQADLENSASTIALQVAQAYLQILLFDEQLENARKRIQTTQSQLDRTERQIKAGQIAPNAKYDLLAQVARDEQQIVTAANNVELSYLNLKNLLELSPEKDIKIEKPSVVAPKDANPENFMFKAVYAQALGNQPQIKAGEYRIKSAEVGVKMAQALLLPSVSASAGVSTNYSSTLLDFTKQPDVTGVKFDYGKPRDVKVNGTNAKIQNFEIVEGELLFPNTPYFNQLDNNLGQGISLNLQIPIFDGFSRKIGIQRQKLNVENQTLALDAQKQQLKTDVQNAIASARAAKKQFEASTKTFEAQRAAYDAADKRLASGSGNSFELTQAKNNLDTAERDVTVAKYDYLFRLKIVEFYEGKKLTLK
jgi:outer membrane protein